MAGGQQAAATSRDTAKPMPWFREHGRGLPRRDRVWNTPKMLLVFFFGSLNSVVIFFFLSRGAALFGRWCGGRIAGRLGERRGHFVNPARPSESTHIEKCEKRERN